MSRNARRFHERVLGRPSHAWCGAAVGLAIACAGCAGEIDRQGEPGLDAPTDLGGTGDHRAPDPSADHGAADTTLPVSGPLSPGCDAVDTGADVLRRLSRVEYQRTLQSLLQLPEAPDVSAVPQDAKQGAFRTISEIQGMSSQQLLAYLSVAEREGEALMADATRRAAVVGCDVNEESCLDAFITGFGRLAYRRPLSDEEEGSLASAARDNAMDMEDRFRFALEGLLTSAHFLYRVEVGGELAQDAQDARDAQAAASMTDARELSAHELASRLSFTLWGQAPDAALLDRAAAGELDTPEGVAAVAATMLQSPHAMAFYRDFFKQWLNFEQLRTPNVAPAAFSPDMLPDMIAESEQLIDEYAWSPNTRFLDVLTTNATYMNDKLASFYGLPSPGEDFVRSELPADHHRAGTGILTHASILSVKTDADLLSRRGAFIRDAFLCQELTIPPDLLDEIEDAVAGLSYLEVVEKRNTQQPCAGCHSVIDPVGAALSQYDAIGFFDESLDPDDFGLPRTLAGLSPPEFDTLAELASKLSAEPAVARCMVEKVFTFASGRAPEARDACTLGAAEERLRQSHGAFPSIVAAMVESPAFRWRREAVAP